MSTSEVTPDSLVDYCGSLARELMRAHEKRFADQIKAVKDASRGLSASAARFGSSVKNAWGSMDGTASEYGMRLAQTVQEIASQLSAREASTNFREAENFHGESVQALNKVIITVRRYVPKLHKGLKTETAALNTALVKLEKSTRALGTVLDDSPGIKVEALQKDAEALARKHDELLELKTGETVQSSTLSEMKNREEDLVREAGELTGQGEFLELSKYEGALRSKEDEIRQFFQPVVKPLLKLERAESNKKPAAIDVDVGTLHGLIDEPVQTVAAGQSFSLLKVLGQLGEALGRGELDVEERKRKKALDTIEHAKNGAVETMRGEYMVIQANIQETLRQLRGNGLLEKRKTIEEKLAQTRREREALSARQKELVRRIDEVSGDLVKQKAALESKIHKLSQKTVTILVK